MKTIFVFLGSIVVFIFGISVFVLNAAEPTDEELIASVETGVQTVNRDIQALEDALYSTQAPFQHGFIILTEGTAIGISKGGKVYAREEWLIVLAILGFAGGDSGCAISTAMKAAFESNDTGPPAAITGEFQPPFDLLGAAIAKEKHIHMGWQDFA